jgi:hypothetical protein
MFPLPQHSEKVHQDVALSYNSSGREDEDYQRTSGSGKGRRLSRVDGVISHEPIGDWECGQISDT